ncbi:MAG: MnhB domain-containing protein [Planctomycetota bacterium]
MNGMTLIVKTVTRIMLDFIVVFAAALTLYGHVTPGGGFAGGSVLACGLILVLLAYGRRETYRRFPLERASAWDATGALMFLAIALAGLGAGTFFRNFLAKGRTFRVLSAGTILWSNIAIFLKVGACLFLVYAVLVAFQPTDEEE